MGDLLHPAADELDLTAVMTSALEAMDRQSFIDWSFGHYLEIAPPDFVTQAS